jgi:hypothetical protein
LGTFSGHNKEIENIERRYGVGGIGKILKVMTRCLYLNMKIT